MPERRAKAPADRPGANYSVGTLCAALDRIAPFACAAEWDNVGLLAGSPDWPARNVLLAIDLTDEVAQEVLRRGADVVVAYHPPIFGPLHRITPDADCPTSRLPELLAARVAIVALHTALDAAAGGTNDVLLDPFEPVRRYPLQPLVVSDRHYKLVVFVPPEAADTLRSALSAAGAGVIGHYHECSFELEGQGTFRGDETTRPAIGKPLVLERVREKRLEMLVPKERLRAIVQALYEHHPYEEPAFDLYPLSEVVGRARVGLGRVGILARPEPGPGLVRKLRRRVDLSTATVIGNLKRRFSSVTAAAGAFGAASFHDPDSLVLTGELKHHEALALRRRGITVICLGHHASERPVLHRLRERLVGDLPGLRIELSAQDAAPFAPLRLP
jgi:dinuclear metal center YbgI/SA1388 family protein